MYRSLNRVEIKSINISGATYTSFIHLTKKLGSKNKADSVLYCLLYSFLRRDTLLILLGLPNILTYLIRYSILELGGILR